MKGKEPEIIDRVSISREGHLFEAVLLQGPPWQIRHLADGKVFSTEKAELVDEAAARKRWAAVQVEFSGGQK